MEKITEVFFNWEVILLSFTAFAVLGVIKAVGTRKGSKGKIIGGFAHSKSFKMFTPVYPYALALILCFVPGVPLPKIVTGTLAVKVMFGVYAGWLSGFSFQIIKKVLEGVGVKFKKKE